MSVHIIKLVVGVGDLEEFAQLQSYYKRPYKDGEAVAVWTRNRPRRGDEILAQGGSLYRVIKNRIQCRQKIIGFEEAEHPDKGRMCLIMVEPEFVRTAALPKKAFQGWRYLKASDAPPDLGWNGEAEDEGAPELGDALREMGLV